jgi:hypothetical protein
MRATPAFSSSSLPNTVERTGCQRTPQSVKADSEFLRWPVYFDIFEFYV